MEFLLLVGCGVLLLMVLKRVNAAHDQTQSYQRTLADISDRLDELTRRIAILTPGAGPAPAAATPGDSAAATRAIDDASSAAGQGHNRKRPGLGLQHAGSETAASHRPRAAAEPPKMAEPPAEPAPEPTHPRSPSRCSRKPAQTRRRLAMRRPQRRAAARVQRTGFRRFRKALRHAMGGLGRRHRAGARRHLPGALLHRGGPVRSGAAHHLRRDPRARSGGLGRARAAARDHLRPRQDSDRRSHPKHPDRGGYHVAYADVWAAHALYNFLSPAVGLRPARPGGAGDARRRAPPRPGARRPRAGRRLCDAAPGRLAGAELLGALHLSHGSHRRGLCAGAHPDVALARDHRRGGIDPVDVRRHGRPRPRIAAGARLLRRRRFRARGVLHRRRIVRRPAGGAGPHRPGVVRRPRRVPVRRLLAGNRNRARAARGGDAVRADGRHRGDRMAQRGRTACRAGCRHSRGAAGRALGAELVVRANGPARALVQRTGRQAHGDRPARDVRGRNRRAVRRRRLSRAGPLGATGRSRCCGRRSRSRRPSSC